MKQVAFVCLLSVGLSCVAPHAPAQDELVVARLAGGAADEGFAAIRSAFVARNPGYDLAWHPRLTQVEAGEQPLALFVQSAAADAQLEIDGQSSAATVGDVALLRRGQSARAQGEVGALVFSVPVELAAEIPRMVRPDWDPLLTDTPGGCAEETGAYRRILLTWQRRNGPYNWRALNAHRVRISDSFTHYHPLETGFDEFYLVQMVQPGARILTSPHIEQILDPMSVTAEQAAGLLTSTELQVGDLVYLPRGTVHRGVGGVLAQVITVPGFRPGAEIGVDRHLAAINRNLGLAGDDALPYHKKRHPDIDTTGIEVELTSDHAEVRLDGDLFTKLWVRGHHVPILHPVIGPGGLRVTRGYPVTERPDEAADHPHHRGLWFTHGDVNGIDFWHGTDSDGRIEVWDVAVDDDSVVEIETVWRDAEGNDLLAGQRRMRLGRIGAMRAIDLQITLQAKFGPVRFGDTKEGSMAIRLAPQLRLEGLVATGQILNSAGDRNGKAWGKKARWVDYSGTIEGQELGVTLLDHPDNPGSPCWWHARGYGLLAANPFGARAFAGLPRGSADLVLGEDESVTFRYRFLFHLGDAAEVDLDAMWRRFAAP